MAEKKENANKSAQVTISNNAITIVLIILLVGAAFAIGYLWNQVQTTDTGGNNGGNTANARPAPTNAGGGEAVGDVTGLQEGDYIRGNRDAKVLLIEYSDLECPFCQRFHPTGQQIVDAYEGDVAWVYRHFPLDQLHPNARMQAEAAECVGELAGNDAFWTFIDAVYEEKPAGDEDAIADLAQEAGADRGNFVACLDGGDTKDNVRDDEKTGGAAGVRGTPGNIIYNVETGEAQLIPGAAPFANFQAVIDGMLES